MKKLILTIVAFIAVTIAVFSPHTLAFFRQDENRESDAMLGGSVSVEISESMIPEGGTSPVPYADPVSIMPGNTVSKIVVVNNVGGSPVYVRVRVDKELLLAGANVPGADLSKVTFEINEEHWEERDGYYYYKEALGVGKATKPLFTEVSFAADMDNSFAGGQILFHVNAYATQANQNGASVFEAQGWPEAE